MSLFVSNKYRIRRGSNVVVVTLIEKGPIWHFLSLSSSDFFDNAGFGPNDAFNCLSFGLDSKLC